MDQFVCDGTCAGNDLGDCSHASSKIGEVIKTMNADEAMKTLRTYFDTHRGDVLGAMGTLDKVLGKVRLLLAWDDSADADDIPDKVLWDVLDELRNIVGTSSKRKRPTV